ncbi:MAG: UDP-N-acetylmuramoyl-L-alanyl-D-glutamate--2,6-diaminopimelate ligase [Peptococcaceae bacterium]|nr:UDP-N-acetylmuramoyl-L-alanyl-D-glutamate--2,6-diaminopimelate ligase [Peptococcaceae bacterium]
MEGSFMQLTEIAAFLGLEIQSGGEQTITGIQYNSQKVQPGNIFVCIQGEKTDGHNYIKDAVGRGAVAILAAHPVADLPENISLLIAENTRLTLAVLADMWYGFPDRKMRIIGVTGTNGKTTTTHLIKWVLEQQGYATGLVGTIHNVAGKLDVPSSNTTPESLELFALFDEMVKSGYQYGVMEVSSHALKQGRVSACRFAAGVFTNLTQDHLDYHLTFEDYLYSKTKLFSMLKKTEGFPAYGVVNMDDAAASSFINAANVPVWTYGLCEDADVRAKDFQLTAGGTRLTICYRGKEYETKVPLIGKFNIYNALAAITVLLAEGIAMEKVLAALAMAPQVPGRFELVDCGQDFAVVVDYAHTPDGLENVLSTAREITHGRVISVFGCGGDRDKTKRPIMGAIGGKYSDFSIITSDNPRTENPYDILEQVEAGIKKETDRYLVIESRGEAIAKAIHMAEAGDLIMIAGKGHENYQLVNGETLHFDDREEARNCLRKRLAEK